LELKEIKLLIAKNETEKAIELLLECKSNSTNINDIILQSNKLQELKRLIHLGLIRLDDYQLFSARINAALLKIIDDFQLGKIENNESHSYRKPTKETLDSEGNVQKIIPTIHNWGFCNDDRLNLIKVELLDYKVFLYFSYSISEETPTNGPNISRATYLRINNSIDKYYMETAINIPYPPFRNNFIFGQKVNFQLIFPKLEKKIYTFDLIEESILEGTGDTFSIKNIEISY